MQVYKIYNPRLRKYATAGNEPRWSKNGNCWAELGHVKNHLRQVVERYFQLSKARHNYKWIYSGCILHIFDQDGITETAIDNLLLDMYNKRTGEKYV